MVQIQDEQFIKDEERAMMMRERFENRTRRFLNAKHRTIGIDKESLNKQVEEKNDEKCRIKEEEKQYALYQKKLIQCLEEREQMKNEADEIKRQQVKEHLLQQADAPRNNAIKMGDPLDFNICGPSSIQVLRGEDHECQSRKKKQQEQIRQWCAKQLNEKRQIDDAEQVKEKKYSEYVLAEDTLRCEMARIEKSHRSELEASVKSQNIELAFKRREEEKKLRALEIKEAQSSLLLFEETKLSENALDVHRVCPDSFSGFSKVQVQTIYRENALLGKEREKKRDEEKLIEEQWSRHQEELVKKMEECEMLKQEMIEKENCVQAEVLRVQREELKKKKELMAKERFGSIEQGFFQKFGTSCR